MKDSIKNRKKKFLALCLSVMMFSSLAAVAACTDSTSTDSSSSSSSADASEEKDTGLIKNAGFETFNTNDGLNAIGTSVTGWSRSVNSVSSGSAISSKAASGILDLSEDAWKNLTAPSEASTKLAAIKNPYTDGVDEVEKIWKDLSTYDKLKYYDAWKEAHKDDKNANISKDLSFYESFNIDSDDIPTIERFNTHHKEGDEGYNEDFNVLMIHNEYPEPDSTSATYKAQGTAQKYTSSSTVTVQAGTSAKFSVWVRTQDLQSSATDGSAQDAVGKGAYISVTHSVGGKSLDAYKIENINTEMMSSDELSNGWKQYTFYIKGSSYTDTTFSLVLGLGQGGGTYKGEYVNGYAFFDDITCETISNKDFDNVTADFADLKGFADEGDEKVIDVSQSANAKKDLFGLDFYGEFKNDKVKDILENITDANIKLTESKANGQTVTSVEAPWITTAPKLDFDKKAVYADNTAIANGATDYLEIVYNNYLKDDTFATGTKLVLLSASGAAYTATSPTPLKFSDFANPEDTTKAAKYVAISFFVKTSDMNGTGVGAGVTLVDGENKTSFTSIDTTGYTPVDIDDNNKDIYSGWQQYFFFLENTSGNDNTAFSFTFNFGPTEITETTTYHHGFAAFANFQAYAMTEKEYEAAQGGTYAKLVAVKGEKKDETTPTGKFDSAAGVPSNAIETGLAHLQNYKGVYSDSQYVTGKGNTTYNKNDNAGLLNKTYFTGENSYYTTDDSAPVWMKGITNNANGATKAEDVWNNVFGSDATQPLYIWNESAGKAYGFIGKSTNIAADSYATVSVRLKVGGNTSANVYLIDTSSDKYNNTLSIGRNLTYWYDDEGNICTGDPAKKTSKIAFYLKSNGLYQANSKWDGYESLGENKSAYFANLNAYEQDANGNLIVAEGGASHNYDSYWNNQGMDGIAFYCKDGKYYAYSNYTTPVLNLADVTALEHRYEATATNQNLMATVSNTNGEWKTVTFYIHTGNVAKDYRLEIWSGDRNSTGTTVTAGSYLIADIVNPGTAQDNFTNLLEEYENKVDDSKKFYGVFSYFDTANHLRYDANLDKNDITNLYEDSYIPSENEEGIAYLAYDNVEANEYTVFADYSYSEKAVTATTPEDDTDDTSSSTETTSDTNPWILASSLAIAVILLFVIVSIIVRKVMKNVRKNRALQASMKNNKKTK